MDAVLTELRRPLTDDAARSAYNVALGQANLPALSGPVRRQRGELRGLPLPALAVELDGVTGRREGAGLQAVRGRAVFHLALAAADDAALGPLAEGYAEVLRRVVPKHAGDRFQRLAFEAADLDGEPLSGVTGGPARRVTVSFGFVWLYED